MKNTFVRAIFCFTLTSLLVGNIAYACSPAQGDNWFTSKISIDQNTLPLGVKIIENPSGYYRQEIVNSSDTPFYLLRKEWPYTFQSINSGGLSTELPDNEIPLYKIVSSNAFFWNPEKGWVKNSIGTSTDSHIGIDLEGMGIKMNRMNGDDRPANVSVPPVQEFAFKAYYGTKPVEIKGKIEYSLNQNYDPNRHAKGIAACNSFDLTGGTLIGVIVFLLVSIAILLSPLLMHRVLKKRMVNKSKMRIILTIHILIILGLIYYIGSNLGITIY